jgi:chromosome segregation ATPase
MSESFETTVDELRAQCDNHRSDIQKLPTALSESDAKFSQARRTILLMQHEKYRLEEDMKSAADQIEREKRLAQTLVRANALEAESKCTNGIEDLRTRFEREKRGFFTARFTAQRRGSTSERSAQ